MIKCLQISQKIRFKKNIKWPITENSSKCVILSWVYQLTLGYTRWKSFWPILYSVCCDFWKFVSQTATYILLLIRSFPHCCEGIYFPHTLIFHTVCGNWAYQMVKYSIHNIRGSVGNKLFCDQSCHYCWTMLGKIKKKVVHNICRELSTFKCVLLRI